MFAGGDVERSSAAIGKVVWAAPPACGVSEDGGSNGADLTAVMRDCGRLPFGIVSVHFWTGGTGPRAFGVTRSARTMSDLLLLFEELLPAEFDLDDDDATLGLPSFVESFPVDGIAQWRELLLLLGSEDGLGKRDATVAAPSLV